MVLVIPNFWTAFGGKISIYLYVQMISKVKILHNYFKTLEEPWTSLQFSYLGEMGMGEGQEQHALELTCSFSPKQKGITFIK